jgi:hypothetical protein
MHISFKGFYLNDFAILKNENLQEINFHAALFKVTCLKTIICNVTTSLIKKLLMSCYEKIYFFASMYFSHFLLTRVPEVNLLSEKI